MKAKEVLNLLRISRNTLTRYVSNGTIRVEVQPNKYYNYNEEDVYKILNKDTKRKIVIYARVSTPKQKKDLENQIDFLKSWCFSNGNQLNAIYSDVESGISFDKRKDFFVMLNEIINHKLDSEEIFDEIVSLLHCYSMELYSKRKNNKHIEISTDVLN